MARQSEHVGAGLVDGLMELLCLYQPITKHCCLNSTHSNLTLAAMYRYCTVDIIMYSKCMQSGVSSYTNALSDIG